MVLNFQGHAAVGAALFLAACAPTGDAAVSDARARHDCFDVNLVTGYESVNRDTIRVRAGVSDEYEIDLMGGQCNTVEWTQVLAIESTPSSWICTGKDPAQGQIFFREPATRRRIQCTITDVRHVPQEMRRPQRMGG